MNTSLNSNMESKMENSDQDKDNNIKPDEIGGINVQGHIKIFDPESGEVFIEKRNAIHYENISEAIGYTLAN